MSPRPKRFRRVSSPPSIKGFKPLGVPMRQNSIVSIQIEEYEALKLADFDDLTQEEASKRMNVSRPTFTRIYESVRKKIADAFVNGKSLVVEGGSVELDKSWFKCLDCHQLFHSDNENVDCPACGSNNIESVNDNIKTWQETNRGRRHRGGRKDCFCSNCGEIVTAKPGEPCRDIKCPKCGSNMSLLNN